MPRRGYFSGFQAPPTEEIRSRVYYHGTPRRMAAKAILREGIRPGTMKQGRGALDPVAGRVYVTASLRYAVIYALGGDVIGTETRTWPEDYDGDPDGYVFVIPGTELHDVQPDEDSVGELLYAALKPFETWKRYYSRLPQLKWLPGRARGILSPVLLARVEEGESTAYAMAGKQLVKRLYDSEKIALIEAGAHIAHKGTVRPIACWRIHKPDAGKLEDDVSNFFEVAKRC